MGEFNHGVVALKYPDTFTLPAESGTLSIEAARRLPKARRGIGLACEMTSQAMTKFPERLAVPGVAPDALRQNGDAAESIDGTIADVEAVLLHLKQGNLILDAKAHTELRKVLAFVRSQEKFDPHLAELVPHLIAYFANTPAEAPVEPTPTK